MIALEEILVADECWVALALLQRNHPERLSFSAREILDRLKQEKIHAEVRAGVQPHIYLHNVANLAPNSARYRMFYRLDDGAYRLFRPGDDFHPARAGKSMPERSGLPPRYHHLLDWYEKDYCRRANQLLGDSDPVLRMRGVGKEIWADEGGDAFVATERQGWERTSAGVEALAVSALPERVWGRIVAHQGQEFLTTTGKPFTYVVEGKTGIWFYRNRKRINQRLGRREVVEAISRCPLHKTTEINDGRDYAYLFGLLTDHRIRENEW